MTFTSDDEDTILQRAGEGAKPMREETFDNVWDAIEDDPAVAENLKLRSLLMIELERHIKREKWTQAKAAKLLGVTQPRISDLMRGKINSFGLDMLVKMAAAAGLRVKMRVKKAA
jgi:predicted XRE-type DNA-binding protein